MVKRIAYLSFALLLTGACRKLPSESPNGPVVDAGKYSYVNRCDFENRTVVFNAVGASSYATVANPAKSGLNRSPKCGRLTSSARPTDKIYSDIFRRKFDFTRNAAIFRLKVLAPGPGMEVTMKIQPETSGTGTPPVLSAKAVTAGQGEWEELVFDFTPYRPGDNLYCKIVLAFDPEKSAKGAKWYFDDLLCPDDDLTEICLFHRKGDGLLFAPSGGPSWRNSHMANPGILSPGNSPDGNWWLYLRGSGTVPYYCDQIGLYRQEAASFNPYGPWKEYEHNPVLPVGPPGSYDEGFLLDTAPVVGKDGVVYVYYNGQSLNHATHGLSVRYSTDGGYTFNHVDKQLKPGYGCSDAVYHGGKYYIYYGGGPQSRLYVSVTEDPLSLENALTYATIPAGGGPSGFDSFSVNGSLVFRLSGVDKWFASYQGSSSKYDFPDRFHIAMSDDLIHWKKVDNRQPLFTRGSAGKWDQGAVWCCEIVEHGDNLYLYYEGWGREGYVEDRDVAYFPGKSCVGIASCTKKDFLEWCGI